MKNIKAFSIISLSFIVAFTNITSTNSTVHAATKTFTLTESTNQTQTHTITLPNVKSITSISSNTGTASVQSISGDSVDIRVSGGSYSRRVQTGGSAADSKTVTAQTTANYNSGGYSGTLSRYLYSGSPSVSKTVTDSRTSSANSFSSTISYNSGGYSGTLSKSGSATSSLVSGTASASKTVTDQASASYSDAQGYRGTLTKYVASGTYTSGVLSSPHSFHPVQPGNSCPATYSDWINPHTVYFHSSYWDNSTGETICGYSGYIIEPSDTRVYRYKGTVTKPDTRVYQYTQQYSGTVSTADTSVYRYQGTVSKPDTRTYQNYYQYNVTVDYVDNQVPIVAVTNISQAVSAVSGYNTITLQGTVRDADNNTVTIGATINGKSKNTTVSSTSTAKNWSLTWNVATDNILEGSYSNIIVTANDGNGGTTSATYTGTVTVDRTKPTATFTPNGNTTYKQTHATTLTTNDTQSGVKTRQYAWSSSSTTTPTTWTNFTEGQSVSSPSNVTDDRYLWVKAVDNVGNELVTKSNVFRLDNTKPTGTLTTSTAWTNGNVTITATGSDAHSGMKRIKKPDGSYATGASTTYTVSANGAYTFEFEDNAGNTYSKSIEVNNIDNTKPTATFTPNGNTTYKQTHATTLTTNDTQSGVKTRQYAWSSSSTTTPTTWTNFTEGQSVSSPSNVTGDRYLWVKVVDNAGNELITKSSVFRLDNTKPTLTIDSSKIENQGTFSYLTRNKIEFSGTASEDIATSNIEVYYYIENQSNGKKIVADEKILEKANNVTNEPFEKMQILGKEFKTGNYNLVVYAVNHVGLTTTVKIPFEVANPALSTIELHVAPQPNGAWSNKAINTFITENGELELLDGAIRQYRITNTAQFPSTFTTSVPANKHIVLDMNGLNYLHIQYELADGTYIKRTVGPYLIDKTHIGSFNTSLVGENGQKVNGWSNKTLTLVIDDAENQSISNMVKQYRIENYHSEWQTYKPNTKITLEGEHRIFTRIINEANSTSEQRVVTSKIDYGVPILEKMVLEKTKEGAYKILIKAQDILSKVEKVVLSDGTEITSSNTTYSVNGLTTKPDYILVKDYAGNDSGRVAFASMPTVTFDGDYSTTKDLHRENVKATVSNATHYTVGNKTMHCPTANCEATIETNTTFMVSNIEGTKETKVTYAITNIDRKKLNLLLSGERQTTDANKIEFKWNYNLQAGKLVCVEGTTAKQFDVSRKGATIDGKNVFYDCYLKGEYLGEELISNRVFLYSDSKFPTEANNGEDKTKVKENIYVEDSRIGTSYMINAQRNNIDDKRIPLPKDLFK